MVGTMTAIALSLAAASAGTQAYGAVQQGKAAKQAGDANQRAYEANAQVAESQAEQLDYNAHVAELQSADATQRGLTEEARFRSSVRALIGGQRAGFAGQGVKVDAGSARDVQLDAARLGELDAQQIRSNAQREAWGFQVQAEDYRKGAAIARKGAAAARVGGQAAAAAGAAQQSAARWQAAGSVIGTGGSLLLQRYGWERTNTGTQRTA